MMQLARLQGPVFDRVVKTASGILVRVSFVVVCQEGEYRPKILSVNHLDGRPYHPSQEENEVVLALPIEVKKTVVEVAKETGGNYRSADFIFDNLFFFKSQLIRGPSRN